MSEDTLTIFTNNKTHFMTPLWKFYLDTLLYNVCFSIIATLISMDFTKLPLFLGTVGTLASFAGYSYFQKNQYYFYYNLGYSKLRLFLFASMVNLVFMVLIGLLFLLL